MHLSKLNYRRFYGLTIIGLLLISVFIATFNVQPVGGQGDWWNLNWQYRKMITIDHTKVAASLTDFPVLINITDTDLDSKAQGDGDDIVFTNSSGSKLDHEIELYSGGHLVAWVRVPSLSSMVDTTLFMYYGNAAASNHENPSGVWDPNYVMVQHLEETSGTHFDSTSNGNDGATQGGLNQSVAGKIDGADDFDGSDDYVNVGSDSSIDDINQITVSAWIKLYSTAASGIFEKGLWKKGKNLYAEGGALRFVQGFSGWHGWWYGGSLATGSWYHVAVTYADGNVGNDPILYINGNAVSITEGATPVGTTSSDAGYNGTIGGIKFYFDGAIDEVRIADSMLSEAWISTEYNNQLDPGAFHAVGSEETRPNPPVWWNFSWAYRKMITINHTKIDADLTNFPVLINITDTDLDSKAQGDGDDIVFADSSGNKVDHEMELYSSGHLVAWVRVPSLSSMVDTTLFMYYGNPTASNQENVGGVWDSSFAMVQHLEETSGAHYDSTANDNDGTIQGSLNQNVAGKIDGADDFDGLDDYINVGSKSSIDDISYITISAWIKLESDVAQGAVIFDKGWTSGKALYVYATGGELAFLHGFSTSLGWWRGGSVYPLDSWCFVAVTYDDGLATNDPVIYLNGAPVSVGEYSTPSGTAKSDASFTGAIGDVAGGVRLFNGTIDEVRISNVIRSEAWISTEYNNQHDPGTFYTIGSEEPTVYPPEPQLSNEYPTDGASEVELNPTLSIDATDYQGNLMNITFSTNATGSWQTIGTKTNVGNGTHTQTTTNMNSYSTKYYWRVNATDGTNWTNKTYSFTTTGALWWNYFWQYRKKITIAHTKVSGNLNNFPVLIDITSGDLDSKAQGDGDDIAFADYSGNKLDHEIELYSGGHLVAWVRVPSLSSATDTLIYMYYGNATAPNQENPTGVWDSHYILVQHLEETAGTVAYDSTANDNDGTPQGGLNQNVAGKVDGADHFDGLDDYINVGSKSSIDNINQITISAWIKPDTSTSTGLIFDKGWTAGKTFYVYLGNTLAFLQGFTGGPVKPYGWWTGGSIAAGSWYHVAVTYNAGSAANDPTFYINGAAVSATEGMTPSGTALSDASFEGWIGGSSVRPERFNGTIDEVRISNPIRSADWISTEYNNQLDPSTFYAVGSEETRVYPSEPWLFDEYPEDGATDVPLNPTLSIRAIDFQGDQMTIIFSTNATGTWLTIGTKTDVPNGTYTQTTTNMSSYSTKYHWMVSATDGTNWTNKTYSFTTRPENYPPSLSNPSPEDEECIASFNPVLSIDASDLDADLMNITFSTNATGTWQDIGSYTNVGDGTYTQSTTGMNDIDTTYYWKVCATDGKEWANETYTFETTDLTRQIGWYYCAGLNYAGESTDKNKRYMIWFGRKGDPPPTGGVRLWYAEFDMEEGWVTDERGELLTACETTHLCAHYGYFGDEYHVFWGQDLHTPYYTSKLAHISASSWSDLQSMSTWSYISDCLTPSGGNEIHAFGSVYAFNNSYALIFFTKYYPLPDGDTLLYWTWDEDSGFSDQAGIPIWNTSCGVHNRNPRVTGNVLLPVNRTTWYLYYINRVTSQVMFVKTTDAGKTWGTAQVVPNVPFANQRVAFARYGDNFYMITNSGGVACFNSTDGEHWGNKQIMSARGTCDTNGVMLDQSHLLWVSADTPHIIDSNIRSGIESAGVFKIAEMIANPGKPSNPYPLDLATLPAGTKTTRLEVKVHGDQTYDVAFYWANGTFIGEDKLLREGDTASIEVSGLSEGQTYQWYTISRGATYGYWGNEPATTSDENRSDTWSFTIGVTPKLEMDPASVTCRKYCENFTVQINLTYAFNVEDFEFEIHYNATLLDYVNVTWNAWGTGTMDSSTDGILIGSTSDSLKTGNLTLITIEFHAAYHHIWRDCPGWTNDLVGTIYFQWANLSYPSGPDLRYERGGLNEISVGPDFVYTFSPIQGDVDNNGKVEIYDLSEVCKHYNVKSSDPEWAVASSYDLYCDGIIDITDLVIIAVNLWYTYDC